MGDEANIFPKVEEPLAVPMRPATAEDQARLIAMVNEAFSIETFLGGTRTDAERLAAAMEKGEILVAEDAGGRLLGSIYMERRGRRGYLGMLAVDPGQQRQGLARRLMQEAEERFRAEGMEAVEIIVLNLRTELPPVYRKLGYEVTGRLDFKPSRPLRPGLECYGIVMVKKL